MAAQLEANRVDREILARVCQGHESALGELYDRHAARLFAVALRVVRRREDAEEVLQDTWVEVWSRASQYADDRGTVRAWLHTILRSRALDRYRSMAARRKAEAKLLASDTAERRRDATSVACTCVEVRDQVGSMLSGLPATQRDVLRVAYFEGLSQVEIAERLQVPLGTVKTWMRRGLAALRRSMTGSTPTSLRSASGINDPAVSSIPSDGAGSGKSDYDG